MQNETFLKSLKSALLWNSLNRLAGFGKHIIIAAVVGLSTQLDIFYMAVALLGTFVFSWAGIADVIVVPDLVKALQEKRMGDFLEISRGFFTLTLIFSLILTILLYFFKDVLSYMAIGFDLQRKQLLSNAISWLLPVIFFYIPLRLLGAILRSWRQFSPFYQADFITAFFVLVCVAFFRNQAKVLLWSFSVGVLLAFFYLLIKTWKFIYPLANPLSPAIRCSLQIVPELLLLQGAQYFYVLIDRIFVSFLPEGSISALAYAMTLAGLPPALIYLSGSFITVVSEHKTLGERSQKLDNLISMSIFLGVCTTCFMLLANQAIVSFALERGVFTIQDVHSVAVGVMAYAWMLIPLFLIGPLDQIFQVEKKLRLIVQRHILGLIVNTLLNTLFLFFLKWGLLGIALATSISYWVMILTSLYSLQKLGYLISWQAHAKWSIWLLVTQALAFGSVKLLITGVHSTLIVVIICFLAIFSLSTLAGIFYPGPEKLLFRKTIRKLILR